jgi:tetratricopeptide (TPR) repeat protein
MATAGGPLSGGARSRYGYYLFFTGQTEAALKEHESAVEGDPLNLTLGSMYAVALMVAGRDADAARECRRILELDENHHMGHLYLSLTYLEQGNAKEALASAERAFTLAPWSRSCTGYLAGLLRLAGDTGRAQEVLEKLGDGRDYGTPFGFLYYHLVCSEIEQAADWAEKAIEQREPTIRFFLMYPLAKKLRQSSRWPALAKMINLA